MPPPPAMGRSRAQETALRAALWLLLGTWIGSWLLFGTVVAPTAFRRMPPETAGLLVGPTLTALHLYGGVAGFALAGLALALGRGRWTVIVPLILGVACLASHFGISLAIDEIRDRVFGPDGSLELAQRFGRLHALSMSIFISVGIGTLVLLGLHAHADAEAADPGPKDA
jgi:hypothetical protein